MFKYLKLASAHLSGSTTVCLLSQILMLKKPSSPYISETTISQHDDFSSAFTIILPVLLCKMQQKILMDISMDY